MPKYLEEMHYTVTRHLEEQSTVKCSYTEYRSIATEQLHVIGCISAYQWLHQCISVVAFSAYHCNTELCNQCV